MVEADAHQLSETIMLEALDFGYKTVQPLIKIQEELTKAVGKIKIKQPVKPAEVIDSAEAFSKAVSSELKKALFEKTKIGRTKLVLDPVCSPSAILNLKALRYAFFTICRCRSYVKKSKKLILVLMQKP